MMHFDISIPGEIHPELATLIGALQDGTREWRGEFETISDEEMIWQPYANGPSIGGCILHIAATEAWWLRTVALGEDVDPQNPACAYDAELDQDAHEWPTPPAQSPDWYFNVLEDQRAETIALIAAHNNPGAVITRPSGNTMTYRWIVAHLVQHDSYHGGQAVMLHEMWKRSRA